MSAQKSKAPEEPIPLPAELPALPAPVAGFLKYVEQNPGIAVRQLIQPFLQYESVLRAYFAQDPDHAFVQDVHVNLISLFEGENADLLRIHARNMSNETKEEKDKYIMCLDDEERKASGDRVLVESLEEFRTNFGVFSEASLLNLDWSNVIAAGSSVMTPLLKVPQKHGINKRALRQYYHELLAPASDIDLFIYGIEDPEEAIKKMTAIEDTIKNNLLWETTTIRTRNTVTIVSQYPNRHVQIVLRLYKSPSQILTGFDVPCSCFAYDGQRVLSNPRALAACITQCNDIDLSRRSPSYENRLSKYSHRGFEVYCDFLDRSRIDPSIFERSFTRTVGLARLLVLEALPKPEDRDRYVEQRRREMGRPQRNTAGVLAKFATTDIKARATDEVAEWDFEDVSSYQKFSIPYGADYNAKRIEKLFFKKDLLLNAEWNPANQPPNRTVALHRHPVFFGNVKDVVVDCCGFCPAPLNAEEQKLFAEEEKIYVNGSITFLRDDPGRQEIGSFYPLAPEDYTDMAYVGCTQRLCEAIVDNDVPYVVSWTAQDGVDLDARDFCGRTPLQLACMSTSTGLEIVQTLVSAGARLVARMQDGRTALHLAAARGRADMVRVLLERSALNEHERDEKDDKRKEAEKAVAKEERAVDDEDIEVTDGEDEEDDDDKSYDDMSDADSTNAPTNTTRGFVKVAKGEKHVEPNILDDDNAEDDDIFDINIVDWDNCMSPLHHAIAGGHEEVVEALVSGFGADVLLPMKIFGQYHNSRQPNNAILNLVLALKLKEVTKRASMAGTLLKLGASSAQANSFHRTSALHYVVVARCTEILDKMFELDGPSATSVIENIDNGQTTSWATNATPLITALTTSKDLTNYILDRGARGTVTLDVYIRTLAESTRNVYSAENHAKNFCQHIMQPLEVAVIFEHACDIIARLIAAGADPSTVTQQTWNAVSYTAELPIHGKTVLETLRDSIVYCTAFLAKEEEEKKKVEFVPRVVFKPDALEMFERGSYRRFCAGHQLKSQNIVRRQYNTAGVVKPADDADIVAAQRKRDAVEALLETLRASEKTLVDAGAMTYHELFPEKRKLAEALKLQQLEQQKLEIQQKWISQQQEMFGQQQGMFGQQQGMFGQQQGMFGQQQGLFGQQQGLFGQQQGLFGQNQGLFGQQQMFNTHMPTFDRNIDNIFTINTTFSVPYLGTGDIQGAYQRLFEAIWRGTPEDANIVKELALGPTGEGPTELPALRISVADSQGFTTLWLALYRGNWDMARLIMAIVREQYDVPKESSGEKRYVLESYDDIYCGSLDSRDEIQIDEYATEFTVEDIGAKRDLVKCNLSPYGFLSMTMSPHVLQGVKAYQEEVEALMDNNGLSPLNSEFSPLSYAIYKNDMKLFRFVLSLAAAAKEDGATSFLNIDSGGHFAVGLILHLRLALALGRIEMLEEIMKTVPFGIPWTELEEADEELQMQKPQFYRGLTVYGTKRKDWASSSFPAFGTSSDRMQKPVQTATYYGQLESIKWLLSDRPFQCLKEFMAAHPNAMRPKLLKKQGESLGFLLQKGLGVETTLLPHLAVKGWTKNYSMETFRFLLARPGATQARSNLHMNLALYAVQEASTRIHKKAVIEELRRPEYDIDFAARDSRGRNVAHLALASAGTAVVDVKHLDEILQLLPADVLEKTWTQRMLGTSQTPLAYWLSLQPSRLHIPTLRLILKYSQGRELGIANNEGNLPIHWVYQTGQDGAARIITQFAPQYIHTENANGRTPVEIATSRYVLSICENPPPPPGSHSRIMHQSVVNKPLLEFRLENVHQQREKERGEKTRQLTVLEDRGDNMELDGSNENDDGVTWEWDESSVVDTYHFAIAVERRFPAKRKLVSLAEANELAKRITSGECLQVVEFTGGDILSLW